MTHVITIITIVIPNIRYARAQRLNMVHQQKTVEESKTI